MTLGYDIIIVTSFPVTQTTASRPASQLKNNALTLKWSFIKVALVQIFFKHYKKFVGTKHFFLQWFFARLRSLKKEETV